MPFEKEHIVKSFDEELGRLSETIIRMGGIAEAQLATAIEALTRRDSDLARQVVRNDAAIDQLEEQLEERTIRLLALRQPLANDLRRVISAPKIASDLERIGDYAANIAKRVIALNQMSPAPSDAPVPIASAVPRMARLVQNIIKDTLDAYARDDAERAIDVWHRDQEVDDLYSSLFRELLTYMMEDPRNITPSTHLLFVAKNIERMGDHATNVAETIHYLVTGRRLQGGRPKSDTTSYQVIEPSAEASPTEEKP